jgi:hypothetical protein
MPPSQYIQLYNTQLPRDALEFLLHQLLIALIWHVSSDHGHTYNHLANIIFLWSTGLEGHINRECFVCYQLYHWILQVNKRITLLPDAAKNT